MRLAVLPGAPHGLKVLATEHTDALVVDSHEMEKIALCGRNHSRKKLVFGKLAPTTSVRLASELKPIIELHVAQAWLVWFRLLTDDNLILRRHTIGHRAPHRTKHELNTRENLHLFFYNRN